MYFLNLSLLPVPGGLRLHLALSRWRSICWTARAASRWSPRCASGWRRNSRRWPRAAGTSSSRWSLILQLLSMALLLLAIAQLRFGSPAPAARDHVIILDTSAWMARALRQSHPDGCRARERARQYLHALPARDRVMLVRADALATPATAFEPDHKKVEAAIQASQPGSTALNLDQALAFARHMQAQDGRRAGEIAFVGTGRTARARSRHAPRRRRICACCWCRTPWKTAACARSACGAPAPIRTSGRSMSRCTTTARGRAT